MNSTAHYKQFLKTPGRTFFTLWLPVLFSMVAEPVTGLVDTAFIAQLGAAPLAALGVGTVVLTSGLWLFNFLSVGSQTEVSQACGENNMVRGQRIASLALLLAGTIGSLVGLLFFMLAPMLAGIMGATGEVQQHAVSYIQIRGFGGPAVLMTITSFAILYGLADMRSPLMIAVGINCLNIILDYVLIFGLGPLPAFGIAGAAVASTISQWIGLSVSLFFISKKMGFTWKIQFGDIRKLLNIGRDMIIRTGFLLFFLMLATRSATQLGPEAGAAHQAIRQVWVFTALFLDASAITAQSLIGYFFGKGSFQEAKQVARLVAQWSLVIGIVLLLVMVLGKEIFAALFVPLSGHTLFFPAWTISAFFQPVAALAFVTDGIHWGTGDFRYLRNAVVFATLCSTLSLAMADKGGNTSLTLIWVITGGWIFLRALLGVLRILPGSEKAPMGRWKSS